MKTGTHVRISKEWHKPQITIEITKQGIAIEMEFSDFIKALAAEVGRPTWVLTQAQLLARLEAAADAVLLSMKRETTPIVR